jgi:hypothetical protein
MDARFEQTSLIAEVERYLAVVELFRAEGCNPDWAAEPSPPADEVRARLEAAATLPR